MPFIENYIVNMKCQEAPTYFTGNHATYRLGTPLGAGGGATVLAATNVATNEPVALKLLKAETAHNHRAVERLRQEFRLLYQLEHPNLPAVYDFAYSPDKRPFIAMEFVDGESIDITLANQRDNVWFVLHRLCETLSFVHSQGLLHLDIKPRNVLAKRTGPRFTPVLIDFGMSHTAKRKAGYLLGSPAYMPPEMIRGAQRLSRVADYYALGVSIYELVEGRLPYEGPRAHVIEQHLHGYPEFSASDHLAVELRDTVSGLMNRDPAVRTRTFVDLRRYLAARTASLDKFGRDYARSALQSIGAIDKDHAWPAIVDWLDGLSNRVDSFEGDALVVRGPRGCGKTFMLSEARRECWLRGLPTAEIFKDDQDVYRAKFRGQNIDLSDLNEACEKDPIVIIIDNLDALPVEDRHRLYAQMVMPNARLAMLASAQTTWTSDRDFSEPSLLLHPPTTVTKTELVKAFSGDSDSSETIRARMEQLLTGADASMRSLFEALSRAVDNDALRWEDGQWMVAPDAQSPAVQETIDEAFFTYQYEQLTPIQQNGLVAAACSPAPLTTDWMMTGADADLGSTEAAIAILCERRLLTETPTAFALATDALRRLLLATHAAPIVAKRLLNRRLDESQDDPIAIDHLSLLRALVGDLEDSLTLRIDWLRKRGKELSAADLRRWCDSGLAVIDQLERSDPAGLQRAFWKLRLQRESERGNARAVIDMADRFGLEACNSDAVKACLAEAFAYAGDYPRANTLLAGPEQVPCGTDARVMRLMALRWIANPYSPRGNELLAKAQKLVSRASSRVASMVTVRCSQQLTLEQLDAEIPKLYDAGHYAFYAQALASKSTKLIHAAELDAADATIDELTTVSHQYELLSQLADAHMAKSSVSYERGNITGAMDSLEQAHREALGAGQTYRALFYRARLPMLLKRASRFGTAIATARAARAQAHALDMENIVHRLTLVEYELLNDLEAADTNDARQRATKLLSNTNSPVLRTWSLFELSRDYAARGKLDDALRDVAASIDAAREAGLLDDETFGWLHQVEIHRLRGDEDAARDSLAQATSLAKSLESSELRHRLRVAQISQDARDGQFELDDVLQFSENLLELDNQWPAFDLIPRLAVIFVDNGHEPIAERIFEPWTQLARIVFSNVETELEPSLAQLTTVQQAAMTRLQAT